MTDRQRLYRAWERHYRGCEREVIAARAEVLEGRMKHLGRLPGPMRRGFVKRTLERALGMSLGIHRQLLVRLHPTPGGVYTERVAGGRWSENIGR